MSPLHPTPTPLLARTLCWREAGAAATIAGPTPRLPRPKGSPSGQGSELPRPAGSFGRQGSGWVPARGLHSVGAGTRQGPSLLGSGNAPHQRVFHPPAPCHPDLTTLPPQIQKLSPWLLGKPSSIGGAQTPC